MMRIRNQKGFTLLEIMLVVLIIGIIALLALPRLLVTRAMARHQTCLGSQQAIMTHLEAYKWDWGFYPTADALGGTDTGSAGAGSATSPTPPDDFGQFLLNPRYWPLGNPGPRECPTKEYYIYDTSGTATSEYGEGPAEYQLDCVILNHAIGSEL